jgi:hypothetical protein
VFFRSGLEVVALGVPWLSFEPDDTAIVSWLPVRHGLDPARVDTSLDEEL